MSNERWFESSSGSGNLSLTIRGLLLALVPLALIAFRHYGVEVLESELVSYVEAISGGLAAIVIFIGLVRKAFNRV